ncbi:hypothetical protein M1145_02320 [Patescibacteria group bacterium]|nr:hypothetical protein [Patescibacteria group bacterium]
MNDFTKYTEINEEKNTHKSSIKSKEIITVIVIVVIIVLLGFAYKFFISSSNNSGIGSNVKAYKSLGTGASPYQAVFLNNTNASVYFGKIVGTTSHWLYLNDVFYLRLNGSNGTASKATSPSPKYSLVHLSPTLSYGPTDHMKINLSQVLFIEDLSSNSSVYKAIGNYYKAHPKK